MPKGTIICNKCHKAMRGPVCACGHTICYIAFKGRRYFRYYLDDEVFNFSRALKQLAEMNLAADKRCFKPLDWTSTAVKERKFEAQVARWMRQKRREKESGELAPKTLRGYEGYVRNHFKHLEGFDIREVGYEQLVILKERLIDKGVGIKTRRNVLNALHAFFMWAHRNEVVKAVPPFPTVEGDDSRVMRALTYAEQTEALERIPEAHRDIIAFMFETGLRIGEVCALKVRDVDLFGRVAMIQRTYSGSELRETTKGKNKRPIPLSDTAHALAMSHVRDKMPEAFLFVNPSTCRGYRVEYIRRVWKEHSGTDVWLYEAGRHSFCTQLIEDGIDVRLAQELLRHKERRSTERYIHASVQRGLQWVNRRGRGPEAIEQLNKEGGK